jgi:hypothetical protein
MPTPKPKFKELRRSYGFDEVAIVPGDVTINPEQTNIDLKIEDFTFTIPILTSAMDAVTLERCWLRLLKHLMPKLLPCSRRFTPSRFKKT